ncbi:DUF4012 domain-containing protein [Candidatus Uhrbacteria bacterium]|nr:DUF4012 domain-containing protein [Candidatus Uhrbacteria bacterium]
MPRKKDAQKPIPLSINPQQGESSPHLLNLRSASAEQPVSHPKAANRTLEETLADFDDRLKDVPDLLKTRVKSASSSWQQSVDALLERASSWSKIAQTRIGEQASLTRKKIRKKVAAPLLPGLTTGVSQFIFIFAMVALITIPLQALLLYRAIQKTQSSLTQNLTNIRSEGLALQNALENKHFQELPRSLAAILDNLRKMRKTADQLGPLRLLLPPRLQTDYALLRLSELTLASVTPIAAQTQDLADGRISSPTLINNIHQELETLRKNLRQKRAPAALTGLTGLVEAGLARAADLSAVVSYLAGSPEPRRLLLIFQNPRELRATGGFAGSFALLTVRGGMIESIAAPEGGTYAISGQLPLQLISPQPLHLINPRFEFQDANWWPHFPTSAAKIADLFQASGGPTVDAVIAITATVGEELLRLHGPLKGAEGNLDAEHFIDTLQEVIAKDRVLDPRAPKKVITKLLPAMVEVVKNNLAKRPSELASTTLKLLAKKDIQLWARDEEIQAAVRRLGWTGELHAAPGDYLAVITSNVGGGKTDNVVKEEIEQEATILSSGVIRKNLRIKRVHQGERGSAKTGFRNVAYLRVYVPAFSRLIKAEGNRPPPAFAFETPANTLTPDPDIRAAESAIFKDPQSGVEIWDEQGKTVFGLWLTVDPGETAQATLNFEVPLHKNNQTIPPFAKGGAIPYALLIEPQAGKTPLFKSAIQLEETLRPLTVTGPGAWSAAGWTFEGPLDKNILVGSILQTL